MFIDIHVHTRPAAMPLTNPDGTLFFTPADELMARYDELKIDKAVLLPIVSPECLFPQSNEEIIRIALEYDDRFIPFCNIDPRAVSNSSDAPLGNWLQKYKKLGCKGVGEVTANLPITDPLVQNLFKFCQELDMPLTFHLSPQIGGCYGLYVEPGLAELDLMLTKFPRLKFLGHSQVFWAEMAPLRTPVDRRGYPDYPIDEEGVVPNLFRQHDNLYGDLSAGSGCNALKRDREYSVKFLNEFQDRLLFGTDICAPGTATPLVDYLLELRGSGEISEGVFNRIARENAVKLLNLQ